VLIRSLRVTTYLLVGLIVLLCGAGVVLLLWGDEVARRYLPAIEAELGEHVGGQVRISELHIDLFPSLGVVANRVVIVPFDTCTEIAADELALRVDARELLKGRYVIRSLAFAGVRTELAVVGGTLGMRSSSMTACNGARPQRSAQSLLSEQARSALSDETVGSEGPVSVELHDFKLTESRIGIQGAKYHTLRIDRVVGAASLVNGVLSLTKPDVKIEIDGIPAAFVAQSLSVGLTTGSIQLQDGELSVGEQKVSVAGRYEAGTGEATFACERIDLRKVASITTLVEVDASALRSGIVSSSGKISYTPARGLSVRAQSLRIDNLRVSSGDETYQASTTAGAIACSAFRGGATCSADLEVDDFGYAGAGLKISRVATRLEKLRVALQSTGEVRATGSLKASSMQLRSETLDVRGIEALSAPIAVSVARGTGYLIQGPVTVRGVALRIADREISQAQGEVFVSLSSAGDTFATSNLTASTAGETVAFRGSFAISPRSYVAHDVKLGVAGGEVSVAAKIQRDPKLGYSAQIGVVNTDVPRLLAVVLKRSEDPFDGKVKKLAVSLNGDLRDPVRSLAGQGSFSLMATRIRGFDLTRTLADALASIPIANLALSRDKLADDGLDKAAEGVFVLGDSKINFSSLSVYRQKYSVQATGSYSFTSEVDLKGAVVFMRDTLSSLGGGFDTLGSLLGRLGKVEVPIFIRGTVPKISIVPDLVTLVKDNSGLTLMGGVLGGTLDAGRSIAGFVLSPFGSRRDDTGSQDGKLESASGN